MKILQILIRDETSEYTPAISDCKVYHPNHHQNFDLWFYSWHLYFSFC